MRDKKLFMLLGIYRSNKTWDSLHRVHAYKLLNNCKFNVIIRKVRFFSMLRLLKVVALLINPVIFDFIKDLRTKARHIRHTQLRFE